MPKVLFFVLAATLFSGCGMKLVKKQPLLDGLTVGYENLDKARAHLCSDEAEKFLDEARDSIGKLIELFVP